MSLGHRVLNAGKHVMKGSPGLVVGVVLIGAAVVCADVPVVSYSQDVESASLLPHRERNIAQPDPVESPQPVQQATPDPNPRNRLDMALDVTAVRPAVDFSAPLTPARRKAIALPPGPSSITLFFMAFGSLGVWHVGRSARNGNLHFGHMPDWYHTGGPLQVGHAAAIDPQFQPQVLSPLEAPINGPTLVYQLWRDVPLHCEPQFCPTLTAPRGPPVLSS